MIGIDTNVLVYALGNDEKASVAQSLILRAALIDCVVPLQVHAEFANVCRKKTALSAAEIRDRLKGISDLFGTPLTSQENVEGAVELSVAHKIAFFDALICAVVRKAGATTLFSEDMQDGFRWNGLRIVNPFDAANRGRIDHLLTV